MFDFPASPTVGQSVTTPAGSVFVWDGVKWTASAAGSGSITISDTSPASPTVGSGWWNSLDGQLYIYYTDPNTSQWVPATNTSAALSGMVAGQIPIAATATTVTSSGNLSGDVTTSNSLATTLATVNANVGTFQGLTLDAKGRVTAASNQSYLTVATAGSTYLPLSGGTVSGALTVAGVTTFNGGTAFNANVTTGMTINGGITIPVGGGVQVGTGANGHISLTAGTPSNAGYISWFKGDGTTRMGYLGWDPTNLTLQLENGTAFSVVSISGGRVNFNAQGISFSGASYGTGNGFVFGWSSPNAGVVNCSIDGGGAIQGFQPVSDERMKTDIAPSTLDCLAVVGQLPLYKYRWLDVSDPTNLSEASVREDEPLNSVGFIAQRAHEVFPEGVVEGDVSTDQLGRLWTMQHNNMLALLTGAIQQLTARLEAVEVKLP